MSLTEDEISEIRGRIDHTDQEIVRLIMQRADLVHGVGLKKKEADTPIYRPDREKQVYENILKFASELTGKPVEDLPFPEEALRHIWREIMSGSIAIEGGPGVAFLGPKASYSHLAVRQKFGSSIRENPTDTIPAVFRTVESGRDSSYGVVPVENSTEGSVTLTLDSFVDSDLKICAEEYVKINLNLLYPGEIALKDIKKLYTIKIVREQCRDWLSNNLPLSSIQVVETSSSAAAAAMAAEKKDGAAIGSDLAAETYGLSYAARSIQDYASNITRFLVMARRSSNPTGDDKTSIVCSVHDRPGSLFRLLRPFHDSGVNLTRIESRTARKAYGDYNFFIDFQGHTEDPLIQQILTQIESETSFIKILGSYPRASLP
jgi:chorismate mutase / prephenate dehydratase